MTIKRMATTGVVATILAAASITSLPAEATTTQKASCVDGGGTTWTVHSDWGAAYTNALGAKLVSNDSTGFTSASSSATTVDYSIRTYDGAGVLQHTQTEQDRAFDFAAGSKFLDRNPVNPPTAPGRSKIVVDVGDGNDGRGNCTVTFVEPGGDDSYPRTSSMPTTDLPGWKQIFTDDFTTDAARGSWSSVYANTWKAYPEPWKDTSKHGIYSPDRTLSTSGGVLDMYIHSEGGQPYVAAPQPRINGAKGARGQTYGRYSVRFRVPKPIPGYKTAWLLWPDSNKSAEGEIDFPEGDLSQGSTIHAFAHDVNGTHAHTPFYANAKKTYDDWHVATIEWLPSGVTYYLDGVDLGTAPKSGTPQTSMHWVLQTETALGGKAPSTAVSGHVEVDWVAVWKRA